MKGTQFRFILNLDRRVAFRYVDFPDESGGEDIEREFQPAADDERVSFHAAAAAGL